MPDLPECVDGWTAWIMAEHPHLARRDLPTIRRLARCYVLAEGLQEFLATMGTAPILPTKTMDEQHKVWADALRLEDALGITPQARQRQGRGDDDPDDGLGAIKG